MNDRTEFTAKTKDAAYERSEGRCEGPKADGTRCGLPLQPGRIVYDHVDPCWLGGDNSLENCAVLGWCCSKPKDAKDAKIRAKTKRIMRRHRGIEAPKRKIPSRVNPWGWK